MLVEVVLELLEFPVSDREGVAHIAGDGIVAREMTDHVDGVADLFVFVDEFFKRFLYRLDVFCFRC